MIIYDKDRFEHTKPLFHILKLYEIKLFQILSLIINCKNRTSLQSV